MKKSKLYKVAIMSLVLCFTLISIVNAVTFKDMPNDGWSDDFIIKAAELGLVKGYSDGTFGPENNVTRFETMLMLSRLHTIDSDLQKQIENKYLPIIKEVTNGNDEWSYTELSKALSLKLLTENKFKELYQNGFLKKEATREDVAVFIVQAMCLQDEIDKLTSKLTQINLPFNDHEQIKSEYKPYVSIAYEKGIISGDNNKNFNPKNPITRKELAIIVCRAYEYIRTNNVKPSFEEFVTYSTFKGTIEKITLGTIESYLEVKLDNSSEVKMVRIINESTTIKLNNTAAKLSQLEKGMAIEYTVSSKDGSAKQIVVDTTVKTIEGTIKYVAFTAPMKLTITNKNGVEQVFNIGDNVVVTLDDKTTEFKNLKKDDLVTVKLVDNIVTQINSISKVQVRSGKIKNIEYTIPIKLTLEDNLGKTYTFTYTQEPNVTRNSVATSFDQLRVGDEATIKTEYDVMTAIDAKAVENTADFVATIKEITIGANNRIKLQSADDEIKEYKISKNARISVLKNNSSIYDLRIGYTVKVNYDGTEITALEVEGTENSVTQTGKIVYVYNASNLYIEKNTIMIQIKNSLNEYETIYLKLNPNTVLMTLTGDKLRVSDLKPGMEVICIGSFSNGGTFDAISIIRQ